MSQRCMSLLHVVLHDHAASTKTHEHVHRNGHGHEDKNMEKDIPIDNLTWTRGWTVDTKADTEMFKDTDMVGDTDMNTDMDMDKYMDMDRHGWTLI
jgi:hypothetical protein